MVAVVGMCVIMNAARFIVEQVSRNNEHQCEWQKPVLIMVPYLFCHQETYSCSENDYRHNAVVMPSVAMP